MTKVSQAMVQGRYPNDVAGPKKSNKKKDAARRKALKALEEVLRKSMGA